MDKEQKILKNVPSYFQPQTNVQWRALLLAHGQEDQKIADQISEAKNQIFVDTAEQRYLDALGENVAVYRPLELNLADEKFRDLVKFLSFYPKQVASLIVEILDAFYNPIFSRYNHQTVLSSPFNLSGGESLVFKTESDKAVNVSRVLTADGAIDGPKTVRLPTTAGMYLGQKVIISSKNVTDVNSQVVDLTNNVATLDIDTSIFTTDDVATIRFETYQFVVFNTSDFANPGFATSQEVVSVINKGTSTATASLISADTKVNLRTNIVGAKGSFQVLGGTANNYLQFPTTEAKSLRVQLAEIRPNEIIIKIPSTIPALRRVLQGSAHIHPDSNLTGDWKGSFLYDPTSDYTVQKMKTTLAQNISAGSIYTQVLVNNSSSIPNEGGHLIFNFGRERMEYPVPYIGRPNNSTLLLNPGYVFERDHQIGEVINTVLTYGSVPRAGGVDLPVYLVGIDAAREQVQQIVRSVVATGVVIRWDINYPICGKF